MYKIHLINGDKKILLHHYSNDPEAPKLTSATGKFGLNGVPSTVIDIPVSHEAFHEFQEFKSHILIEDESDSEIFMGRMINPSDSFNSGLSKVLIFEGELAYLNDSTIRPKEWHDYSVKDFLKEVLEEHNRQVEDYKKIYVGNVTVSANLYRMANYDKTLPFLLDRLPKRLGGFFNLRKVNGVKYLDYLLDVGELSKQEIVFGENMLDFQIECDTTGIFTKLVPLGADTNDGTQESQVGNRVTIESVNDGKDYLINAEAAAAYGLMETTKKFDDVTVPANLKTKGEEYLKEISKPLRKLKMKVADMHEIMPESVKKYSVGDSIPIKCPPFKVDEGFRIIEISLDYLNPINTEYTFGNKIGNLTDKQIIMQNSQAKIDSFFNDNGLKSAYLDGTINLLSNNMRAMVDSADKHDGTAILFECKVPGDLYGAMAVGTRGFMIASEMNSDGSWNWRTFGTGKGFFADLIIAGKILGANLEINLDTGEVMFSKGLISGKNLSINLDTGVVQFNKGSISGKNITMNLDTGIIKSSFTQAGELRDLIIQNGEINSDYRLGLSAKQYIYLSQKKDGILGSSINIDDKSISIAPSSYQQTGEEGRLMLGSVFGWTEIFGSRVEIGRVGKELILKGNVTVNGSPIAAQIAQLENLELQREGLI